MAEILLNLSGIHFAHPGRTLFENLDWEIQADQRVGLVGPNGAGKSTLLHIARGALAPGRGQRFCPPGVTIGYLPQEPRLPEGRMVLDEALTALPELAAIEAELRRLETRMGDPAVYGNETTLARVMAAHQRALLRHERLDGSSYENRVQAALDQVGLGSETWDRPVAPLSGGQKKLFLLAQLLVRRPRLLLLDEPDNHLDLAAKELLEKVLRAYSGGVVLISHDRYLLDGVATHIVELSGGRLDHYVGNYSAYADERELRRLRQQRLYAAQQKEIARIEAAIARFEKWASMVVDERHIRQARSRRRMLEKMDRIDPVFEQRRMGLALEGGRGSRKAVELIDVAQTLPDGNTLWKGLSTILYHGERVALVGPNGAGKSMLLRRLLDPDTVSGGEIKIGPSSRIGYYAQEHETLVYEHTLLEEIRHAAPLREENVVAFLHRFLFTYDQIRSPIRDLSGGERSRLQLAKLMLQQPNLLVLDEPTNNLDLVSIEVLEDVLAEFDGTVLIVSHDRYFLDRVVDRVLELRDGRLREFLGGYSDYLEATR